MPCPQSQIVGKGKVITCFQNGNKQAYCVFVSGQQQRCVPTSDCICKKPFLSGYSCVDLLQLRTMSRFPRLFTELRTAYHNHRLHLFQYRQVQGKPTTIHSGRIVCANHCCALVPAADTLRSCKRPLVRRGKRWMKFIGSTYMHFFRLALCRLGIVPCPPATQSYGRLVAGLIGFLMVGFVQTSPTVPSVERSKESPHLPTRNRCSLNLRQFGTGIGMAGRGQIVSPDWFRMPGSLKFVLTQKTARGDSRPTLSSPLGD